MAKSMPFIDNNHDFNRSPTRSYEALLKIQYRTQYKKVDVYSRNLRSSHETNHSSFIATTFCYGLSPL